MDKLLVFIKNPVAGKVKTRLAKTVGNEKALNIYLGLLNHTLSESKKVNAKKTVCYSDYIEAQDNWAEAGFEQQVQQGDDLGDRMLHAFRTSFEHGFTKVILIGSDCLEISTEIISQAFIELDSHQCVIGPAKDGGYYLIGMKQLLPQLVSNKKWSTDTVFVDTVADLEREKVSYSLLQELTDIDEEKDIAELNL